MSNVSPLKRPDGHSGSVNNHDAELKELLIAALASQQSEKQPLPQASGEEFRGSDGADFHAVIAILLHSKWLLIVITALALLVGKFFAYIAEPVYSTNALVRIEKKKSLSDSLAGMFQEQLPVADEIEILRSRMILEQVVKNLDMDIIAYPHFYPVVGKAVAGRYTSGEGQLSEAKFGAMEYAWGGERIEVKSLEVPPKLENKRLILVAGSAGHYQLQQADGRKLLEGQVGQPVSEDDPIKLYITALQARPGTQFILTKLSKQSAVDGLAKRLTAASKGSGSNILVLKLTSADPDEAAVTLNEIIRIYLEQNVAYMSEEASKTLSFLETQLPRQKALVDEAVSKLNAYRLAQGSVDLTSETSGVLDGIISAKGKKQELASTREALRSHFTESHPKIKSIDAQIRLLNNEIAKMNKKVSSLPDTQQMMLRLVENVELTKKLYISLVSSAQELRMAKAGTVGNVRVIDYALPAKGAFSPSKSMIVTKAVTFGLFFALALVFIRQLMNKRGIEDPRQIEDQLGMPVYASIPHSTEQENHEKAQHRSAKKIKILSYGLLALELPKDPAVEGLMSLGTRLHFAQIKNKNNITLISGPSPGIGKSFISANLSVVLAKQGKKVLVIDADIRRGHLNRYFDLPRKNGLSEYLGGILSLKSAVHKTRCPNLYLLPTGELPPNPVELLMGNQLPKALNSLNRVFDHIIIDSSPILAVTDASILARLAGITLLVAKSGAHTMSELEQCVDKFDHDDVNLRGVILNDAEVIDGYGYSYGRYVYQYDYVKS